MPHLRRRLGGAEPLLVRPLSLSAIPYGLLRREPPAPHLWPLGDQAVVIPSLTGDGMSLALHTAALAAQTFLAGDSSATYLGTLRRTLRLQLGLATFASRLAVRPRASAQHCRDRCSSPRPACRARHIHPHPGISPYRVTTSPTSRRFRKHPKTIARRLKEREGNTHASRRT